MNQKSPPAPPGSGPQGGSGPRKRLLENKFLAGLIMPIAIVFCAVVIIFTFTQFMASEKSHRELLRELESKTFGNRWVAAYELSKLFAADRIRAQDQPEVVQRLSALYQEGADRKTRHFLIVALGALRSPLALPALEKALKDNSDKVRFAAVVALGNLPAAAVEGVDWEPVMGFLESDDQTLRHAAILALAQHYVPAAEKKLVKLLDATAAPIRYAAATGLIHYRNPQARERLREILLHPYPEQGSTGWSAKDVRGLKLNVIARIKDKSWDSLEATLAQVAEGDANPSVAVKAREALNLLQD